MAFTAKPTSRTRVVRPPERSFRRQIIFGVCSLVFLTLVSGLVYYVTRIPFFTIQDITVTGGETISHEDVRYAVSQELIGSYFLLVPKSFSYTFPKDRIQEVLDGVERIYNVHVERTSRTALSVTFDEYDPFALWCTADIEHPNCYFLDEKGYAFAPAPDLQGGTLVRHVIERLTEPKEDRVIEQKDLERIHAFIQRLEVELSLRVTTVVHKQNTDFEFVVNGGGMILVAGDTLESVAFDNLKSVLSSQEFKHIEPGNFKYIDVRFDNKVFVNEKIYDEPASTTEAVGSAATGTASTAPELPQ